jgi:uncharacterized protein YdeI (YjbR/CyaY-like superfamily)
VLKTYIQEAIAIEESGQKVEFKKTPEPICTGVFEPIVVEAAVKNKIYFECLTNLSRNLTSNLVTPVLISTNAKIGIYLG